MKNYFKSIVETKYLLSTKANKKRLIESMEQAEKGELKSYSLDEIADISFSGTIDCIQQSALQELNKIAINHLCLLR